MMTSLNKIGILGGTFDPLHMGHLTMAECARDQLGLDKVLFLPVGQPPHKLGREISAIDHRIKIVELGIAGNSQFQLDTTDANRPAPHTTVTLLPLIQQQYPTAQLWLIIGMDSLVDFPNWVEPQKIIQQCRLAVVPRPDYVADWEILEREIAGIYAQTDLIHAPAISLAATDIRQRIQNHQSITYLVPPTIQTYIQHHNLYSPIFDNPPIHP
jgi:nicotinate-nucleotide adenylyltransferase